MPALISLSPRRPVNGSPRHILGRKAEAGLPKGVYLPGEVPRRGTFRPIFTLRWGRRGTGKTLSLVADGHHFRQAYITRGLRKGWTPGAQQAEKGTYPWLVAANFQNAYADITRPDLVEALNEYPAWAWNIRLQVDEIGVYAHRRRWQLNLNFESFITQMRKRSIEPCGATQFPQRLDGDIVEQIDLFIDCGIEYNGCGIEGHAFCVAQRIHDWWGQWSGKTWKKPWPPNVWDYDDFRWFHNCARFFGAYVTEEIHAPIWLKQQDKNRIRLPQWGGEITSEERAADLAKDTEEWNEQAVAASATAHGQLGHEIRHEMAGWEPYAPDLSIGAPGPSQLAEFLRYKAASQPGGVLSLWVYVREAATIDPNIATLAQLQEFCQKQGWLVRTEGGSKVVHIP